MSSSSIISPLSDIAREQDWAAHKAVMHENCVFFGGKPNVHLKTHQGQVTAEILGVDVYDSTTWQLRSHNTEGIACSKR